VRALTAAIVALALAAIGCGDDGRELRAPPPGATAPPLPTSTSAAPAAVNPGNPPAVSSLALTSEAFAEGAPVPARHTCDGENVSPPLAWTGVPAATVELALTMADPDARGFVHWVVTGIDPAVTGLAAGALPEGAAEGRNDSSEFGWTGPCPPQGELHRYVFTLYALTQPVAPDASLSPRDAIAVIASVPGVATTLSGAYGR
jgi:Raf kinase inhibitor-like YbhB/YbcL family protein